MLNVYMNYYNEAKMKEFASEMSKVILSDIFMDDIMYITVDNEENKKLFIFAILGRSRIYENNIMSSIPSCTLEGNGWVAVQSCIKGTEIYVETPENIFKMLSIIKDNEEKGIKVINGLIHKYCLLNCIHNYRNDFIMMQ